jgi:hypothetical protein
MPCASKCSRSNVPTLPGPSIAERVSENQNPRPAGEPLVDGPTLLVQRRVDEADTQQALQQSHGDDHDIHDVSKPTHRSAS